MHLERVEAVSKTEGRGQPRPSTPPVCPVRMVPPSPTHISKYNAQKSGGDTGQRPEHVVISSDEDSYEDEATWYTPDRRIR